MKKIMTLIAVSATALTLAACGGNSSDLPPGHYEKTYKSTNAYGTETTQKRETDVYYDEYGNKKTRVEAETTKDPKGLFNKTTTKKTTTVVK